MVEKDRRRESRMRMTLPVRVQGTDAAGSWREMTSSSDACFGGASFLLKRPVSQGQVLQLDLPLPKSFRRYDLTTASYRTFALVRDLLSGADGLRVGVMFIGKTAPRGYEQNPAGLFLMPEDQPPPTQERRRHQRRTMPVSLRVQRTDAIGPGPTEERPIVENVGRRGAQVLTSMMVAKGDVVVVEVPGGAFQTRAEIKNVFIGDDNIPRLNLYFIDSEFPERAVH